MQLAIILPVFICIALLAERALFKVRIDIQIHHFRPTMNFLAVDFYEKVALYQFDDTLTAGTAILGRIGAVCSEFLERKAFYAIRVSKGSSETRIYKIENGRCAASELTSRKHLHHSSIYLNENNGHRPIDPAVSKHPTFCKRNNVYLWLKSSKLSKEIIEIVGLIPIVSTVTISTPVTETIVKIMEKMVEKKTLNCLEFSKEHQFNAATTEAVRDLLKQEQFEYVVLCANCDLPLERIIAEWSIQRR